MFLIFTPDDYAVYRELDFLNKQENALQTHLYTQLQRLDPTVGESSAGFVFGWDRAMYSLIAYFIAFKVIDLTIEGLDESKAVMIVSDHPELISERLMARLGRGVTRLEGKGCYSKEAKGALNL